ncbi:MAG: M48 family metalloprotease [Deltaproteobacteria bacterium]|nr:M48 family metalloprotease [Deltaproteobacteria bacterium]
MKKLLWISFSLFLTLGCSSTARNKGNLNIYSVAQDAKIGAQFTAQVKKEMPMLYDEKLIDYMDGLGQKIVNQFPEDKLFEYHFHVVKEPDLNAFTVGGGYVFVYLGLLHLVETEAELAMVVGHEIGHVVFRHVTESLTKAQGFSCCLAVGASAVGLGQTEAELINLFGQTGMLYFGRAAELESDRFGVEALHAAGFDLKYAPSFFEKLLNIQKFKPGLLDKLLSTHPPLKDRIAQANEEVKKYTPKPNVVVSSQAFKDMKEHLQKYPNKYKKSELRQQYIAYLMRHLHDDPHP